MSTPRDIVRGAMEESAIHQQWASTYRTAEAEAFYVMAFTEIARRLDAPPGSTILDAGCGSCAKSVLLAANGFQVVAADFSPSALVLAERTIQAKGLGGQVTLRQEDLLGLSFSDGEFKYIISWGVLMHVPNLQGALAELSRVLAPGGVMVLSEGNMHSLQSVALRLLKRLLNKGRGRVRRVPAGLECVEQTRDGDLLTRQTDMKWLAEECARLGLIVRTRIPGQFSELYAVVSSARLKRFIHAVNTFWFRYVRRPGPAFGNIIIIDKPA